MGTGVIGKVAGDVAGLGLMAGDVMTGGKLDPSMPLDVRKQIAEAMTYQPRSAMGQAVAKYNPLALLGRGYGAVTEGVGGAIRGQDSAATDYRGWMGNLTEATLNELPGLIGAKTSRVGSKEPAVPGTPLEKIRAQSQEAGLVTPVEGTSWLAGVPGAAKVNKWVSAANQGKAIELTAEDLGLPKGVQLTADELTHLRSQYGKSFRAVERAGDEISSTVSKQGAPSAIVGPSGEPIPGPPVVSQKTGFVVDDQFRKSIQEDVSRLHAQINELPETFRADEGAIKLLGDYATKDTISGAATMKAIRKLRRDSAAEMRSDDPAKISTGFVRKEVANRLEDLVERNLERTGQTELLARYKHEREITAKTYDIESAMDPAGRINMRKLYMISQKRPLSGNLKLMADFAGTFPEAAQKVSGKTAIGPWDWMFSAGAVASGHPMAAAAEVAGKAGVPWAAQRGMLQTRNPQQRVVAPGYAPAAIGYGMSPPRPEDQ